MMRKHSNLQVSRFQCLVQLLNLACFVGTNSFILAHPCHWFDPLPTAFNFIRGTCINTTLALLHVIAAGTQPWVDKKGMLFNPISLPFGRIAVSPLPYYYILLNSYAL